MSEGPRRLDVRVPQGGDLDEVRDHLREGGVIAYPTETVYGLGGTCTPATVERVRVLKRREASKPLIALLESREDAERLVWTDAASELAKIFWPGSLTLVLLDPERSFPDGVRDPVRGTVAVRVSPHPLVANLLAGLGAPITSTSCNLPGQSPAASGEEAARVVRALGGDDVWLLDAGVLPESAPSTVVDCTTEVPSVLRHGAVPLDRLRCAIPETDDRTG